MVRLKAAGDRVGIAITRFQFQYGSIKSYMQIWQNKYFFISIPIWFD